VIYNNFVDHGMINMIYQFGAFSFCNKKAIGIAMARETITQENPVVGPWGVRACTSAVGMCVDLKGT
jgi:hypothetical protein